MPAGRPPKTVDNCLPENWKEIILEMSAEGKSEVQIRAKLCLAGGKFSHDTWYALQERDEEFTETIKIGNVLCQAWWENVAQNNLIHYKDEKFETGCWYANMKNRFGWRDNKDTNVTFENAEEYFKEIATAINRFDTNTNSVLQRRN